MLDYNPETGKFVWKIAPSMKTLAGTEAGTLIRGYRYISIWYCKILAHRLAWFYMYGQLPSKEIDHINGIRDDNRIVNLRLATKKENQRNRRARREGLMGTRKRGGGRWESQIVVEGKTVYLGTFDSEKEAHLAYHNKAKELYGEFAPLRGF